MHSVLNVKFNSDVGIQSPLNLTHTPSLLQQKHSELRATESFSNVGFLKLKDSSTAKL